MKINTETTIEHVIRQCIDEGLHVKRIPKLEMVCGDAEWFLFSENVWVGGITVNSIGIEVYFFGENK